MPKMSNARLNRIRRALLGFYDAHRRALPWREDPRPCGVWISEVMLQQTRVEAVVPLLPQLDGAVPGRACPRGGAARGRAQGVGGTRLLCAGTDLHRAALLVRERPGAELPESAAALRGLPGFGEYTAGAVASIAFGERLSGASGRLQPGAPWAGGHARARARAPPSPSPTWKSRSANGPQRSVDRPYDSWTPSQPPFISPPANAHWWGKCRPQSLTGLRNSGFISSWISSCMASRE